MPMNMMVFKKDQVPDIVDKLGMNIDEDGFINDNTGEVQRCHYCDEKIHKDHLGNILPGSTFLCCDNIMCFIGYIAERDLEFSNID